MKIYLVERYVDKDLFDIIAIFKSEEDAKDFVFALQNDDMQLKIAERTLFYGQPSNRGFNL